jgi:hypothetical protein
MDRESQVLLVAAMLVGTALAAMSFPGEILNFLWALLAGAVLAWVYRRQS